MSRYLLLAIGSILWIVADQLSKIGVVRWLVGSLPEGDAPFVSRVYDVTDSWFRFRVVGNKGAAWGLFRGLPEAWRVPFFVLIALVAAGVIIAIYRKTHEDQRVLRWALTFIMGGAIGNLIDRIVYGFVVDFIEWYHNDWRWPTFNVADVAITIGVGLLIIDMILQRKHSSERKAVPGG